VGPRPPLPDEYATYDDRERRRLAVTPGITCIWQVSGRSDLDFHTWVSMDLEYIETWTLRKDLEILARTVPAVVSGRGAY
jgi:lipopolysaccharide/colanic/teichoic acid biosynthesis glycosyltransferase